VHNLPAGRSIARRNLVPRTTNELCALGSSCPSKLCSLVLGQSKRQAVLWMEGLDKQFQWAQDLRTPHPNTNGLRPGIVSRGCIGFDRNSYSFLKLLISTSQKIIVIHGERPHLVL
jgi:hypothetical protein